MRSGVHACECCRIDGGGQLTKLEPVELGSLQVQRALSKNSELQAHIALGDDLVLRVMATAFKHLKLVIEPGGAVALAAALDGRLPAGTECAVTVASGGNVDAEMFTRALQAETLV